MSPRRPLQLLIIAVILLGSGAYLGVTALGFSRIRPQALGGGAVVAAEPDADAAPAAFAADEPVVDAVTVELRHRAELVPPPAAAPELELLRGDGTPVEAELSWAAGSAAAVQGSEPPRGYQLVRVRRGADESFRVVHLAGHERHVALAYGGPLAFRGRVVAEGEAVAGAEVWLAGQSTRTDGDGGFEVEGLDARYGLPLVVRAPGCAWLFRVVDAGYQDEPKAFSLEPGARLRVRGPIDLGGAPARVRVLPSGGAATGDARLRHYPFFWPVVSEDGGWQLDAAGQCIVDGLPRGAEVAVALQHPDAAPGTAVKVRLDREQAEVTLSAQVGRLLRGRLLDDAGAPLAGACVVAGVDGLRPLGDDGFLLPRAAQLAVTGKATTSSTDVDGNFTLALPPGEAALVRVLAQGRLGLLLDVAAGDDGVDLGELVSPSLTTHSLDAPVLQLSADRRVRLVVERGRSRSAAVLLGPGDRHDLRLDAPALFDVVVRSADGHREYRALAVHGGVDLPLDG